MIHYRKFELNRDLTRLEQYLRDRYFESRTELSWLPERLNDLVYRISAFEADEEDPVSMEYFFLGEEEGEIRSCILPDGENIYMSIKPGYESHFPELLSFSEKNCLPLFDQSDDGSVKLWFALSNRLSAYQEILKNKGYEKYAENEYENVIFPQETDFSAAAPDGFRCCFGEDYADEENKWTALRLGFHPEWEETGYRAGLNPYRNRKKSSLYDDCFECLILDPAAENGANPVAAYSFVYVDRITKTALIEPVSTREKYRHKGLGTVMMQAAIRRCKEAGIEKCYVNSFGSRKDFYVAAGFRVEDSIGYWYKTFENSLTSFEQN